jgi:cytoskeletal protein CcmA (bactofilin family)
MNFKKILTFLSIVFFAVFIFALPARAESRERRAIRVTTIPKSEVIDKASVLKIGEIVEVSGTVKGDLYALGKEILIDGDVEGDLIAVGQKVVVSGMVGGNVRILAQEVYIEGVVTKNTTVMVESLVVSRNAHLGGGLIAGATNLRLDSKVARDVAVLAETLNLSGEVGGDLVSFVKSLNLLPGSLVNGNITYTTESQVYIDKTASISGSVSKIVLDQESRFTNLFTQKKFENDLKSLKFGAKILSFLSALVIGVLVLKLFPKFSRKSAGTIKTNFWKVLGVGFLVLIGTPFVVLLIFITIIGIPLALAVICVYIALIYLSKIIVSYQIGLYLTKKDVSKQVSYLSFILGLVIFYIVSIVPYLGGITSFVVLLAGMGSLVLTLKEYHHHQSTHQI